MRKAITWLLGLGLLALGTGWTISSPPSAPETAQSGDVDAGRLVFAAAGCASCHTAPKSETIDAPILAGGKSFVSDFGTFFAPNISSDKNVGIGSWSDVDVFHAITTGVSPDGKYYYPAFPSHSYALANTEDIWDLVAYLRDLPADTTPSQAHDVGFPFNVRRGLWLWRTAFAPKDWVRPADTPELERGRYLVEALGHCAECHTPRNALGGFDQTRWMQGAPSPDGKGKVPALQGLEWSAQDIAYYLETGFTPDFDSAGGEMADVVQNTAKLSAEDRDAIAAYIKGLAP